MSARLYAISTLVAALLFSGFLPGCGVDVCVAGFGNCDDLNNHFQQASSTTSTTGTTTGNLSLILQTNNTNNNIISVNQPIQISVTNGNSPYSFSVFSTSPPSGSTTAPSEPAPVQTASGANTANFTPTAAGTVVIQAVDSSNNRGQITITVTN